MKKLHYESLDLSFVYKTLSIRAANIIIKTRPQINPAIIILRFILSNSDRPYFLLEKKLVTAIPINDNKIEIANDIHEYAR